MQSTFRPNNFVSADQAAPKLERWQRKRLNEAAAVGKKNIKIKILCQETSLTRRIVLDWLKNKESTDLAANSRSAPDSHPVALLKRKQTLESFEVGAGRLERAAEPSKESRIGPKSVKPSWKFSKAAEATMEMVFEATPRPSGEVITSISDLHRIPRRQVLYWFTEKREQ